MEAGWMGWEGSLNQELEAGEPVTSGKQGQRQCRERGQGLAAETSRPGESVETLRCPGVSAECDPTRNAHRPWVYLVPPAWWSLQGLTALSSGGLVSQSCLTLATPWSIACQALLSIPGSSVHGIFQARILPGMGCHFLLQQIFLTQGLNSGLLYCRRILYQLSLWAPLQGPGQKCREAMAVWGCGGG